MQNRNRLFSHISIIIVAVLMSANAFAQEAAPAVSAKQVQAEKLSQHTLELKAILAQPMPDIKQLGVRT